MVNKFFFCVHFRPVFFSPFKPIIHEWSSLKCCGIPPDTFMQIGLTSSNVPLYSLIELYFSVSLYSMTFVCILYVMLCVLLYFYDILKLPRLVRVLQFFVLFLLWWSSSSSYCCHCSVPNWWKGWQRLRFTYMHVIYIYWFQKHIRDDKNCCVRVIEASERQRQKKKKWGRKRTSEFQAGKRRRAIEWANKHIYMFKKKN